MSPGVLRNNVVLSQTRLETSGKTSVLGSDNHGWKRPNVSIKKLTNAGAAVT